MPKQSIVTVPGWIEAGESLSPPIDVSAGDVVALMMPDQWTYAELSFQISADNVTHFDLYERDGDEVRIKVTGGGVLVIERELLLAASTLRLRSGSRTRPVTQAARRDFFIALVVAGPAP